MADTAPNAPSADGEHPPARNEEPLEEVAPPRVVNSDTYCGRFRLMPRFVTTTSITARPLISIPINFMALIGRITALLQAAYVNWNTLRSLYSGNDAAISAAINNGCTQMAKAFVLMIYNHLRYKCSVHDSQNQGIYRSRCYLDSQYELPSGLATLVELFGFARPDQNHFNETYLHRWDHEHHGDNEFGINTGRLNSHILDGFVAQLINAGVPTRRVDKYCAPRNLWDSLYIVERTGGCDVYTTYANVNYILPKDIFYAVGLCGPSALTPLTPIQFYPPRLSEYTGTASVNNIKGTEPVAATAAEQAAMPTLGTPEHATDAQLRVNGTIRNMHLTGTERVQTGTDVNNNNAPVYTERAYIYGRGGAQAAMTIDCVARGVTPEEMYGFYRALLRHG